MPCSLGKLTRIVVKTNLTLLGECCADVDSKPLIQRGVPDLDFAKIQILFNIQTFVYILMLF